jgi:hypothetical protein
MIDEYCGIIYTIHFILFYMVIGLGGDPADDSLNNRDADSNLFADLNDEDEPDVIGVGSDNFNSTIQVRSA